MSQKKVYRSIVLSGEISEESAKEVIQHINDINENDFDLDKRLPIQLKINSPGGSMYDGFAIIGAIESSETPVYTYGFGTIMSMALPILVSGVKRFAHPLTTFMYHECLDVYGAYDKLSTIKENLEETDRVMKMYDSFLISKTVLKQKQLDKIKNSRQDWYFDVNDAIKYNIIDQII